MSLSANLKIWPAALLVCACVIGCAAMTQQPSSPGSPATPGSFAGEASALPPKAIPGGLTNQPVDSKGVIEAANQAIGLLRDQTKDPTLSLVKIRSAQTQVVAGFKYYLEMDVTTQKGARTVNLILFQGLSGDNSLSGVEGL